jgi:hypothetical protein
MKLVDNVVRTKLSNALGAPVSFDSFKASLLGGSLDVGGLAIGGDPAAGLPLLLHVRRALAHVSLGRALKREVAVKSLTLERPVVRIVRTADGRSNFPLTARQSAWHEGPEDEHDGDNDTGNASRWTFDCDKVLLVDGEFHVELRGPTPYRLCVLGLLGELQRTPGGDYDLTLIADAVHATHDEIPLGEFKAHGKIAGAPDLSHLPQASLSLSWNLAALMRGRLETPSLESRHASGLVEGTLQTPTLLALLPIPALAAVSLTSGQVEFRIEASHRPDEGIRITEAIARATGVRFPLNDHPRRTP